MEELTNNRVRGARKVEYDGKLFDSKLEVNFYKLLVSNNIPFEYNNNTVKVVDDFRLDKVNYYSSDRNNREITQFLTKKGLKQKISAIKYTPDFIIEIGSYLIYVELKGYQNDVYPYKRKLFFSLLENSNITKQIYFFEPRTIKQSKTVIEIIKSLLIMSNSIDRIKKCITNALGGQKELDKDLLFNLLDDRDFDRAEEFLTSLIIKFEGDINDGEGFQDGSDLYTAKSLLGQYISDIYGPEQDLVFDD